MKAYRGDDNKIRLFRPMENMRRLNRSADRACLPVSQFALSLLLLTLTCICRKGVKAVTEVNQSFRTFYCSLSH